MKYRDIEDNTGIINNNGVVLACRYFHKLFPNGLNSISPNTVIKNVKNKEWEVFYVEHETKDAYYGKPMLGLGLMNCFILKKDTRKMSASEFGYVNGRTFGVYGSHTDRDTGIRYKVDVKEVVSKWNHGRK